MTPKSGPNPFLSLLLLVLIVSTIYSFWNPSQTPVVEKVAVSQFVEDVKAGNVANVEVQKTRINYTLETGEERYTFKESTQSLNEVLAQVPVEITQALNVEVNDTSNRDMWLSLLFGVIPFILVGGFIIFMMSRASNSNNQAMSFGKSGARTHDKEKEKTTLDDVAGVEEAKEELAEIVDFLKHPSKYTSMGAKIPKGVMLVGAPGTGKTLLARAVAGEASVPFFSISGSEFVEMFVGVGASRVRDLFRKAKRNAPCIIFVDEIDAVGRKRGSGVGGGHDEREQTLNQILTEMDGFETGTNVIVMAATNRPDVLDEALLRPGRFDRRIVVDAPSLEGREAILKIHARNKPMATDVDLKKIARQTPGFTGADLENLLNESAIRAARLNQKEVNLADVEESIEKVQMGPERKSHVLSKEEKDVTAHHEMGHAIVGHVLEDCDPLQKITIIPRGMSLGSTWFVPEDDKKLYTKRKFEHRMASLLGGYVAEEMIYGQVSTGPSNDLERATQMARQMVTKYGMSDLGPVVLGEQGEEAFLGRDRTARNYSEEQAALIDKAVKEFVHKAYLEAKRILHEYKDKFLEISHVLIEKESLSRDEFIELFDGKKLKKKTT